MRLETKNLIVTVVATLAASGITGWVALQSSKTQSEFAIKQMSSETARLQSSLLQEKASTFLNKFSRALTYRQLQDPSGFSIYRQRELLLDCQNYALEIQPYLGVGTGTLAMRIAGALRKTFENETPNWTAPEEFSKSLSTDINKFLMEIDIELGGLKQKADPSIDNSQEIAFLKDFIRNDLESFQEKWYRGVKGN